MRSVWRTLDRGLARDVGLVCVASAFVGLSFGAITVSADLPWWLPMLLSVVVFAGAAQFLFIGLIASGGNPVAAVAAGVLVNVRHVPFGFAVADILGTGWKRIAGCHLMIDESVAFALAQRGTTRRRAAYWACGMGLFVCWNAGVVVGTYAGAAISDTDAFGLDAAFPAVLLALVLPSMRGAGSTRPAVLGGAAIALATAPFLPAGAPVLLALAAVPIVMAIRRDDDQPPDEDRQADDEGVTP